MSRRAVEWGKDLLIIALLALAALMVHELGILANTPLARVGNGGTPVLGAERVTAEAARPYVIVVTNETGERLALKYGMDELDMAYRRLSSILGEALGSATVPVETTEREWRSALGAYNIYFEYRTAVELPIVAGWLGADDVPDTQIMTRRMCVSFLGDTSRIFIADEPNGKYYRFATAALGATPQGIGSFAEGLQFEFERNSASPAPYMLLQDTPHRAVVSYNPIEASDDSAAMDSLLEFLGLSSQYQSSYADPDGTRVYVTNAFIFSVSPTGRASYRVTDQPSPSESSDDLGTAIEVARRAAAGTVGALSGEARVQFTGVSVVDGAANVTFDYFIAGGRVFLQGAAHAARVTVRHGTVVDMTLNFRSYSQTEMLIPLLPERQAIAAANGEFRLGYSDAVGSILEPYWYAEEVSG
ncbi:MAG: hypothetical protein LBN30_02135 [Oscillospiraceae bacterium]|jgi:hypothetical protein|nr:hypothetical protein [Oscillospiraceae bacterium]